jgi:hypothetical protein
MKKIDELPIFPLLEIFGGTLGILLLFVFVLLAREQRIKVEQMDPKNLGGISQIKFQNHNWYIVSCYKDYVKIEENKEIVTLEELQKPENRFYDYCKKKYTLNKDKVMCQFLFPGSNDVKKEVDKIIINYAKGTRPYFFLVINEEIMALLLKTGNKYFGQ